MKKFTLSLLLLLGAISVKAQCSAEFTHSIVTCDSIEFFPVHYGPGVTYSWDFGDGESSTATTPAHGFDADGSYFVVLTVTDGGCTDVFTGVVEVDCGSPCSVFSVASAMPDSSDCNYMFIGTATGGTPPYTYSWDFGDGSPIGGPSSTVWHTYDSGVYIVEMTATDADGCESTSIVTVAPSCTPVSCDASFLVDTVTCDSFVFIPVMTSATNYYWNFGDGTSSTAFAPDHGYDADGTYFVVLTVEDSLTGCYDTYTYSLVVDCDYPCTVSGDFGYFVDTTNCGVDFAATAFGGTAPYTFEWNFGDGGTATGCCPTNYYIAGTYTPYVTITDASGCDTTIYAVINVDCDTVDACNAYFNAYEVACDSFYFDSDVPTGADHFWDFGDGFSSTDASPFHTYSMDGTYIVIHSVYDSLSVCSDTYYLTIVVDCDYPCTVVGDFASYVDTTTCGVTFTATAFGGVGPYSFEWAFGDGTTETGCCPTHYYPPGTWTPTLTIYDLGTGCDTTIYDVVYVDCDSTVYCSAYFTVDDYYCDSIWFMPEMTSGVSHTWDFGDGYTSSDVFANHTYLADGSYTVIHTVYDSLTGCFDAYTYVIEVACDSPCTVVATASAYLDSTDCSVHFSAAATGGVGPYTYEWYFGDGTTGTGCCPTHIYPSGSWTPTVIVTDAAGCETSYYLVVDAYCDSSALDCNAYFDAVTVSCDSIWFSPYTGSSADHTWDFGDGTSSTETSPTHVYDTDGIYVIYHTVSDPVSGCYDTYVYTITINCDYPCTVDGDFVWYVDSTSCEVVFTSTAFGGTAPYTYDWNFGDGSTSTSCCPTHDYSTGTWTPTLTITDADGCDTTIYHVVDVYCDTSYCVATFTTSMLSCDTYQFFGLASTSTVTYSWDFGDGATSTEMNPIHTFDDGTYSVYLTTYDSITGCTATYWDYFIIDCDSVDCTALFTYTFITCDSVYFIPVGGGPGASYFWDFGDGTTSTEMNPTHTFDPADSIYYVILTVSDSTTGCYDVYTAIVYIDCGTVGFEDDVELDINIYPNPTQGLVNIVSEEPVDYSVISIDGKVIFMSNTNQDEQIDLSDFANGMYYVRIVHGNNVITKPIVKQ